MFCVMDCRFISNDWFLLLINYDVFIIVIIMGGGKGEKDDYVKWKIINSFLNIKIWNR